MTFHEAIFFAAILIEKYNFIRLVQYDFKLLFFRYRPTTDSYLFHKLKVIFILL